MTRNVERSREVGQSLEIEQSHPYGSLLAAYHRIHAAELREVIAALPLYPGDRVLDVTCGEGMYSVWLAKQISPGGTLVGIDQSSAALMQARAHANASGWGKVISFKQGDRSALSFSDNTFDLVWCDQNRLGSDDWEATLREIRRVVRPGGYVALMADTIFNHILLPWPPEIDAAFQQAHVDAGDELMPASSFVDLHAILADIGLEAGDSISNSITRHVPFSLDERNYLASYVDAFKEHISPYLSAEHQEWLTSLCTPQSGVYLLDMPNLPVTYRHVVVLARKK